MSNSQLPTDPKLCTLRIVYPDGTVEDVTSGMRLANNEPIGRGSVREGALDLVPDLDPSRVRQINERGGVVAWQAYCATVDHPEGRVTRGTAWDRVEKPSVPRSR